MYKTGDRVTVLDGPGKGSVLEVVAVRMFATDNGYYLDGGAGLYSPDMVALSRERTEGNPCRHSCEDRLHQSIGTCEHCRGICSR